MMVRFERSTLPEHANTRTIVLRFLECLSPVRCAINDYDSYISLPTSGDLLSGHYQKGKGSLRPWSTNLDIRKGKTTRMFSLLWPSLSGKDLNVTTWKSSLSLLGAHSMPPIKKSFLIRPIVKTLIGDHSYYYEVTDLTFVSGAEPIVTVTSLTTRSYAQTFFYFNFMWI